MFHGFGAVLRRAACCASMGRFATTGVTPPRATRNLTGCCRSGTPVRLRDIKDVTALAAQQGMRLKSDHNMPANNRLLEFAKD